MAASDFAFTLLTDQTPEEVFKVVTDVRSWWSGLYAEEITGETDKLNREFSFRAGDGVHYSRQRAVEVVPNEKIVWLVTESSLSFIEKTDEWTGTKVIFEISESEGKNPGGFHAQWFNAGSSLL